MKKKASEVRRQWRTSISRVKKSEYLSIGIPKLDNKGFVMRFGYGYIEDLKQYVEDPLKVIKAVIANFSLSLTKQEAKAQLDNILKKDKLINKQTIIRYKGLEVVQKLFNYFNIFDDYKISQSISFNQVVFKTIDQSIKNMTSIFSSYATNKQDQLEYSFNNQLYSSLDYITKNNDSILKNIYTTVESKTNLDTNILYFDVSNNYSKKNSNQSSNKFKSLKNWTLNNKDFIVATLSNSNKIPLYYKIFPSTYSKKDTFIPLLLEVAKIYNKDHLTIIADKSICTNKNIRFLESMNWKYITFYKMQPRSKDFSKYVLSLDDYQTENNIRYKIKQSQSLYNSKRANGSVLYQIITYSDTKALEDRENREAIINSFTDKMDQNQLVSYKDIDLFNSYSFIKPVNNTSYYQLDKQRIREEQKYDGYYVYVTNISNLKISEIINLSNNSSTFKSIDLLLDNKSISLLTINHIEAYICLCFITLIYLNYLIYKINDQLKLEDQYKITEEKLFDVLYNIKELEVLINNQKVDNLEIINQEVKNVWETYKLLLDVLVRNGLE